MRTYLVTGGCGFIGSHLVDALINRGHAVRVLDNLSTGTLENVPKGVEVVIGDVAEPRAVSQAFKEVDGCFHLAAIASVERSNSDWLGAHRTNLTGAITVFDAARATSEKPPVPVVFASSAAVYGDPSHIPINEAQIPHPVSAYGADKLGCELHGSIASHVHGVPSCGLRFFNVYGPRQNPKSPYSGVISIFCERVKSDGEITIYGDGRQVRDFIYVGDVVRALMLAMERCSASADVINVCTGAGTMIVQLAQAVGRVLGRRPRIMFEPPRRGEIRTSVGDPTRAITLLGFRAETPLEIGLANTLSESGMRNEAARCELASMPHEGQRRGELRKPAVST